MGSIISVIRHKLTGGEGMKKSENKASMILPLGNEGLISCPGPIITDPNGSYTGLVHDPDDKPVQDADDL